MQTEAEAECCRLKVELDRLQVVARLVVCLQCEYTSLYRLLWTVSNNKSWTRKLSSVTCKEL